MGRVKKRVAIQTKEFGIVVNYAIRYCLTNHPLFTSKIIEYAKELLPDLHYSSVKTMWNDVRGANIFLTDVEERKWDEFCMELCAELDRRDSGDED